MIYIGQKNFTFCKMFENVCFLCIRIKSLQNNSDMAQNKSFAKNLDGSQKTQNVFDDCKFV